MPVIQQTLAAEKHFTEGFEEGIILMPAVGIQHGLLTEGQHTDGNLDHQKDEAGQEIGQGGVFVVFQVGHRQFHGVPPEKIELRR